MLEMPQALINAMQALTASTNGKPSLQWPGTTFGVGWRSNSPDTISRSACAAVSDENTPLSHAEPARKSKLAYMRCWPAGGGMRGCRHGSASSAASPRQKGSVSPLVQVADGVHAAAARVGVAVQHDARAVEVVHASVSTRRSRRRRSARCARLCGRSHATGC